MAYYRLSRCVSVCVCVGGLYRPYVPYSNMVFVCVVRGVVCHGLVCIQLSTLLAGILCVCLWGGDSSVVRAPDS